MVLFILEIEAKQLSLMSIKVLNLIRDEPYCRLIEIHKEMVLGVIFIDKKVNKTSFQYTVKHHLLYIPIGDLALPFYLVLLFDIHDVLFYEFICLFFILIEVIESCL